LDTCLPGWLLTVCLCCLPSGYASRDLLTCDSLPVFCQNNLDHVVFVCWNCECSLVSPSSHNAGAESMSVQVMVKLPTGETLSSNVPAIVIVPSLSSTVASSVLSQSITAVSLEPMQSPGMTGIGSCGDQLTSQASLSLNSQAPLGLQVVASPGLVTGANSQPSGMFDLPESGLTALGIAASTREACVSIVKFTVVHGLSSSFQSLTTRLRSYEKYPRYTLILGATAHLLTMP